MPDGCEVSQEKKTCSTQESPQFRTGEWLLLVVTLVLIAVWPSGQEAFSRANEAFFRIEYNRPARYSPSFFAPTVTPTPSIPPSPTPTIPIPPTKTPSYYHDDWPRPGWIAPHLQYGIANTEIAKIFGCSQISPDYADHQFVVARLYNTGEREEIQKFDPYQVASFWIQRFKDTFSDCQSYIDAAEIFNEVSGDGDISVQTKTAIASRVIAEFLHEQRIRPIVFNYPVGAPTPKEAFLPEVLDLLEYVSEVDGAVGVHIYFPCGSPEFPLTWNFVSLDKSYRNRSLNIRYVATELGICVFQDGRWHPYRGWKECNLSVSEYHSQLQRAIQYGRQRVNLAGGFVFTVAHPSQGWESFEAHELFATTR